MKPVPPNNLWEQLDKAYEENCTFKRPKDSFTAAEYAEHIEKGTTAAKDRLAKLVKTGIVVVASRGRYGKAYYIFKKR